MSLGVVVFCLGICVIIQGLVIMSMTRKVDILIHITQKFSTALKAQMAFDEEVMKEVKQLKFSSTHKFID